MRKVIKILVITAIALWLVWESLPLIGAVLVGIEMSDMEHNPEKYREEIMKFPPSHPLRQELENK